MDVENTQGASTETEETQNAEPQTIETVDYQERLNQVISTAEQLAVENQRLAEERDNYEKGMLAAKKRIKALRDEGYAIDDEDEDKSIAVNKALEDRFSRLEQMMTKALESKTQEVETTTSKLNKTISELKISLANRVPAGSAPISAGTSDNKPDASAPKWTNEQLEYFKKNNLDAKEVWNNLQKPNIVWSKGGSN